MYSSLLKMAVLLAATFASSIDANPVPDSNHGPLENRALVSPNPTTIALPDPTPIDPSPAINTGVITCQKNSKPGYRNCLANGRKSSFPRRSNSIDIDPAFCSSFEILCEQCCVLPLDCP